jgi:hypothetical protein
MNTGFNADRADQGVSFAQRNAGALRNEMREPCAMRGASLAQRHARASRDEKGEVCAKKARESVDLKMRLNMYPAPPRKRRVARAENRPGRDPVMGGSRRVNFRGTEGFPGRLRASDDSEKSGGNFAKSC